MESKTTGMFKKYIIKSLSHRFLSNSLTNLKFCMFDTISPVILYCHCLQRIEKGVIIETIHFIGVVLENELQKLI